ncbi:MAG: hypothetical protein R2847_02235 [Bacteroidia bacterium]
MDNMKVYLIPKAGSITTNDIQTLYQVGLLVVMDLIPGKVKQ